MKQRTLEILESFYIDNPEMVPYQETLSEILDVILKSSLEGKKILVCGNGGSASDSDHIVGELMKGFELLRPLPQSLKDQYESMYGEKGLEIANQLQVSIPAISLTTHHALITAFENDVDPSLIYAQQVNGYGEAGDILIGISTSGNASNVNQAMMVGNVLGLETIGLTGKTGGDLAKLAKYAFIAPANSTYKTQEFHLRVYHVLCRALESEMFEQ